MPRKYLSGLVDDDKVFALLYEPDNTKDWMNDDNVLEQANP
jgi:phage terminase large subunit-like protein